MRDPAETRRQILKQALRLFAEEGYAAVSLRRIAESCGLTIGAVHHHFGAKDALYEEVRREADVALNGIFRELWRESDGRSDDVHRVVVRAFELAQRDRDAVRFRMREWMERSQLSPGRVTMDSTLLSIAADSVATRLPQSPTTLRLWMLAIVFLIGRFSLSDAEELRLDLGADYDLSQVPEDLAALAERLLRPSDPPTE